jgi:hypothetical protein
LLGDAWPRATTSAATFLPDIWLSSCHSSPATCHAIFTARRYQPEARVALVQRQHQPKPNDRTSRRHKRPTICRHSSKHFKCLSMDHAMRHSLRRLLCNWSRPQETHQDSTSHERRDKMSVARLSISRFRLGSRPHRPHLKETPRLNANQYHAPYTQTPYSRPLRVHLPRL